jgi:hypothetical protein
MDIAIHASFLPHDDPDASQSGCRFPDFPFAFKPDNPDQAPRLQE